MTVDGIRKRLDDIKRSVRDGDNENAHVVEDRLYRDVLQVIASVDNGYPGELAREALKSIEIDFVRNCS
jgi:hypothetical protein